MNDEARISVALVIVTIVATILFAICVASSAMRVMV